MTSDFETNTSGLEPVCDTTKQALLDISFEKLSPAGFDESGMSATCLETTDGRVSIIRVFNPGGEAYGENGSMVASIWMSPDDGSTQPSKAVEEYKLVVIPDGLHLERDTFSNDDFDPNQANTEEKPNTNKSVNDNIFIQPSLENLRSQFAQKKMVKTFEPPIGDDFVSEPQARELLFLINSAETIAFYPL